MAYVHFIRGIICLLFFASSALASTSITDISLPSSVRSSEKIYNLPGLSNVGRVAPGVLRGAQPGREGYAALKAMGVKTVIDMRTSESERKQVEAAGMSAIAIPIEMTREGLKEKVDRVVALMADPATSRSMSTAAMARIAPASWWPPFA